MLQNNSFALCWAHVYKLRKKSVSQDTNAPTHFPEVKKGHKIVNDSLPKFTLCLCVEKCCMTHKIGNFPSYKGHNSRTFRDSLTKFDICLRVLIMCINKFVRGKLKLECGNK